MKIQSFHRYVISLLAGLSVTAFAHPGGHGEETAPAAPSAEKPLELPTTMAETVTAIQGQLALLKTAQKDGKFSAVAANAVTLN